MMFARAAVFAALLALSGADNFLPSSGAVATSAGPAKEEVQTAVASGLETAHEELKAVEAVTGEQKTSIDDVKATAELAAEVSMNPYMHNGPTAEALAAIFMGVCLMICWIECCK